MRRSRESHHIKVGNSFFKKMAHAQKHQNVWKTYRRSPQNKTCLKHGLSTYIKIINIFKSVTDKWVNLKSKGLHVFCLKFYSWYAIIHKIKNISYKSVFLSTANVERKELRGYFSSAGKKIELSLSENFWLVKATYLWVKKLGIQSILMSRYPKA